MHSIFNTKMITAVDFSSKEIRVVQTKQNKHIHYMNSAPMPTGAFVNDRIVDPHSIAGALISLLKTAPTTPKDIVFGIPDSLCFSSTFTLDATLNATLIETELIKYAKNLIPIHFEETYWDYAKQKNTSDAKVASFIYFCVPDDVIAQYGSVARECNIEILTIDSNALALGRVLLDSTLPQVETNVRSATLILYNGDKNVSINVFNQEKDLIFSANVPLIDITNADAVSIISSEVEKVIQQNKDLLGATIDRIIIAGEIAVIPDVGRLIQTSNNIPVIVGDGEYISKTTQLEFPQKEKIDSYAIALGLSLCDRKDGSGFAMVNFLQHGLKNAREKEPGVNQQEQIKDAHSHMNKNIWVSLFTLLGFGILCFVVYTYIIAPFLLS